LRHAARRDDTEPAIVKALELAGWTVLKVSDTGIPDLLCLRRGVIRLLEVKSPGGTLTPAQVTAFRRIEAALVTVHVVRTPEEALMAVGAPVEGVLPPLEGPTCSCGHGRQHHVQGTGRCIRLSQEYCPCEHFTLPKGHLVTPAYRREQTEAVVPPKKRKR